MPKLISLFIVSVLVCACAAAPAETPSSEPLVTPTQSTDADAACSPASVWTIEYHRTGGIGGFDQTLTLQSDGSLTVRSEHPPVDKQLAIPENHVEPIGNLLAQACPFPISRVKGTCADCFNYELTIQMDDQTYDVQASDTTLTEEIRPLITTLNEFLQLTSQ